MNECPFCPLERLTPWHFETVDGMTVCQDLNNKNFKYRLLVVGSGKSWHRPIEQYSTQEIARFLDLGKMVADDYIKEGKAKQIEDIDMQHFSISQHFHVQVALI